MNHRGTENDRDIGAMGYPKPRFLVFCGLASRGKNMKRYLPGSFSLPRTRLPRLHAGAARTKSEFALRGFGACPSSPTADQAVDTVARTSLLVLAGAAAVSRRIQRPVNPTGSNGFVFFIRRWPTDSTS